jgi:hypothetical protein
MPIKKQRDSVQNKDKKNVCLLFLLTRRNENIEFVLYVFNPNFASRYFSPPKKYSLSQDLTSFSV